MIRRQGNRFPNLPGREVGDAMEADSSMPDETILVSACLLGTRCRFDGRSHLDDELVKRLRGRRCMAVCPELLAGLAVPRPCCEMTVADDGAILVSTEAGDDVTGSFMRGAERTAGIARDCSAHLAVFKSRSPSCGTDLVYDGTFSGTLVPGSGVTTRLLRSMGMRVMSEHQAVEELDVLARTGPERMHREGKVDEGVLHMRCGIGLDDLRLGGVTVRCDD